MTSDGTTKSVPDEATMLRGVEALREHLPSPHEEATNVQVVNAARQAIALAFIHDPDATGKPGTTAVTEPENHLGAEEVMRGIEERLAMFTSVPYTRGVHEDFGRYCSGLTASLTASLTDAYGISFEQALAGLLDADSRPLYRASPEYVRVLEAASKAFHQMWRRRA